MSKRLEVGDEVVCIESSRYDEFNNYYFQKVVSVTETRAKLSGGTVLLRDVDKHGKYKVYGKSYCYGQWGLCDEEIVKKANYAQKIRLHRKEINEWFKNFRPDFETKEALYKQFNQQEQ